MINTPGNQTIKFLPSGNLHCYRGTLPRATTSTSFQEKEYAKKIQPYLEGMEKETSDLGVPNMT